ncbi:MAG: hypothetical protein KC435_06310 [Thermomicrobiales bacterium]|nr:hypothetical protein [Thermomicrobiales bacterium]
MVKKLTALFALMLALGMSIMPVAAQELDADAYADLGLESAYSRLYIADGTATNADPNLLGVMAIGFHFDKADTAEDAFEEFTCGFIGGFIGVDAADCDGLNEDGTVTVDTDIAISDDPAIEAIGTADFSGTSMPMTLLAVQSDENIFMVINLGVAESQSADALGGFLADAEAVDTEVEFNADGTSTGGFFDMLPQDGDKEIEGLAPSMDTDFLNSSATPAA